MKKTHPKRPRHQRFSRDPNKKYVRKLRFYPSFTYRSLDRWLQKMSRLGWHLVDSNAVSFLFEQGTPKEKVYFTYDAGGSRNDSGRYSIPLRYPFLEKTFGIKKKASPLNRNEAKAYQTIEIDTERRDIENDVSYQELVRDRDRLYTRLALRNASVAGIGLLLILLSLLLH